MTAKTMAEVLAEHRMGSYLVGSHAGIEHMPDIGIYESRCQACGPIDGSTTAHQAAALSAAGFGLVADAKAEAWDRGMADMLRLQEAGPGYEMGNPYRKYPS